MRNNRSKDTEVLENKRGHGMRSDLKIIVSAVGSLFVRVGLWGINTLTVMNITENKTYG